MPGGGPPGGPGGPPGLSDFHCHMPSSARLRDGAEPGSGMPLGLSGSSGSLENRELNHFSVPQRLPFNDVRTCYSANYSC